MMRMILGLAMMAGATWGQTLDVATPYRKAVEDFENGELAEATSQLEALVASHDRNAIATIGSAFGNVWYHLGLCRLEQGDTLGAALAFKRCHVDYANRPNQDPANAFEMAAMIQRAEIDQAGERYREAAGLYTGALRKTSAGALRDRVLMNLAVCLHETGDLDQAARICDILIGGESTALELRHLAVLQTCRIGVERNDLSAVRSRLNDHPDLASAPILERLSWTPILLHIGRRCVLLDDPLLALRIYELAVGGDAAQKARGRASAVAAVLDASPPVRAVSRELDPELLLSRADAWFQLEAWRLARAGYEQAAIGEDDERHAQVLHAASVCSALLDESDRAEQFAMRLADREPDYPMLPEVLTVWIESLMRAGRLREARDVAMTERDRWEPGNYRRERLDILAASVMFRLEEYVEAGEAYQSYLSLYPKGTRRVEASYSLAVCHLHQRLWGPALRALDELLESGTAGEWVDGALYYRAFCRTMTGELKPAEADLKLLLVAHAQSPHRGAAWNLLGDHRFQEKSWEQAEEMYAQAEACNDREASAYAAYQRMRIAIARQDPSLAMQRYQAFRAEYEASPVLPKASVAVARIYEAQDRAEEAIHLLTQDILDRSDRPRDPGLSILMDGHNALYKRAHGYQALVERLRDFPGPSPSPRPLAAWLALAEIEALESVGGPVEAERLQELYRFLAVSYELDELDSRFILKLARWLERSGETASAISYYTMLTRLRDDPAFLQQARIERARLLRIQPDADSQSRAMEDLQRVLDESSDPELREAATIELARHGFEAGDWNQARSWWERALADPGWQLARGEATYGLAFCLDQLGLREEARRNYLNTCIHFEGQIDWSAPAFLRRALMAREDGEPDQARQILGDMMARMGHLDHPVVNRARTLQARWQSGEKP